MSLNNPNAADKLNKAVQPKAPTPAPTVGPKVPGAAANATVNKANKTR